MKNSKLVTIGLSTLLMAFTVNFNHANNDYGIKDNIKNYTFFSSSSGSSSSHEKIKMCRSVGCTGMWRGTADLDGCIYFFNKKKCNYGVSVNVELTYSGQNENCTGGTDFEDCDACQKDCVPKDGFFS